MRDVTVGAIQLAGFSLFLTGFILSGCLLTGCAKNHGEDGKAGMENALSEDSGSSAPARAPGSGPEPMQRPPFQGAISGTVVETMNASRYTYLLVDTGGAKVWAAVPECAVKVGDAVKVPEGIAMDRFHSETLDRTFDLVYFSQGVEVMGDREGAGGVSRNDSEIMGGLPQGHPGIGGISSPPAGIDAGNIDFTGLERPEGGSTVADIFTNKDGLSGKEVLLRGKVVKFNRNILGKNWLHLRDGTGAEGGNDLTINTQAEVDVGDTVLARGMIVLNKDFGFGYKYEVLIEDAVITKE
ncbi:MAG: hypothetical protein KJ645_10845 [Planctomycetes bacterium]|nr:hypothetical protein [Planctomycetota bacterium]